MVRKKPKENNTASIISKVLRSQRSSINGKHAPNVEESHKSTTTWSSNMVVFPPKPAKENTLNGSVEYMVCENQHKSTKSNSLTRISEDFDETSLYISAIEDMSVLFHFI